MLKKLNQEILAFTENAYYYIQNYSIGSNLNNNDFETELKREYNLRLERRQEYIQKNISRQKKLNFSQKNY